MIQAGKLRHKIAIEKRVPLGDGFVWQVFAAVWADKRPLSAREFINANQVMSSAEGFFVIRWMTGIDATMRVREGYEPKALYYQILGVLEDNESGREWITLPFSRGTNEG